MPDNFSIENSYAQSSFFPKKDKSKTTGSNTLSLFPHKPANKDEEVLNIPKSEPKESKKPEKKEKPSVWGRFGLGSKKQEKKEEKPEIKDPELSQEDRDKARLSEAVYGGKSEGKIPQGWEQISVGGQKYAENKDTGFAGAAYRNKNTGEVVVAFRGTDDSIDWLDNGRIMGNTEKRSEQVKEVSMGLKDNSKTPAEHATSVNNLANYEFKKLDQYDDATKFYEQVKKEVGDDANISLTGHSLGGALAQLVGAKTGKPTVTYNAPGVKHLTKASGLENKEYSNITNYSVKNDWISLYGTHLGKKESLKKRGSAHSIAGIGS